MRDRPKYIKPSDWKRLEKWHWPPIRAKREGYDLVMEYMCPHGIGHGGVHGCDGCCSHPSFLENTKEK